MRVLIMDDNRDILDIYSTLLSLWGHEVWVVEESSFALPTALRFLPDVLLLDVGMDGCALARQIRQEPALKGAVLAALTGYSREDDGERILEAGFDAHLVKPVEPEVLKAFLEDRELAAKTRTSGLS